MKLASSLTAALLIGMSVSAWGFNVRFMKDAPISKFSDEDLRIFKQAVSSALDDIPDGESADWRNPETSAAGTLTLIRTFEERGTSCRRMRIANTAGGLTAASAYNFCRAADGSWEVVVQ